MKYGRFHIAEAFSAMHRLHTRSTSETLTTVDWEPHNGVLDQENLIAQGIDTSVLIPTAPKVDALGSCTANATMSALSRILDPQDYLEYTQAESYDDVVSIEKAAIRFYHSCTDETGTPTQEWPPTDCGSTGPYIVEELLAQKLISNDAIAVGADNICSLLQRGGLIVGQPFLAAWEHPDEDGFIDGDGSSETLQAQIMQGVAGGHETYCSAIEKISFLSDGSVDPANTILRFRNSWTAQWGDSGNYRAHLSTYVALGSYCDFRLLVA